MSFKTKVREFYLGFPAIFGNVSIFPLCWYFMMIYKPRCHSVQLDNFKLKLYTKFQTPTMAAGTGQKM